MLPLVTKYHIKANMLSANREETEALTYYITKSGFFATYTYGRIEFDNEEEAEAFITSYLFAMPGCYFYRFAIIAPNGEPCGFYQLRER